MMGRRKRSAEEDPNMTLVERYITEHNSTLYIPVKLRVSISYINIKIKE